MQCTLCGSENVDTIYNAPIRDGELGRYTERAVEMYQCKKCHAIWHDKIHNDIGEYYESKEYRDDMGEGIDEQTFYLRHDKETMDKFRYTGTTLFRNKVVADIGCGCGAFLDYIKGVASEIVAIEPTQTYREVMTGKGFHTFSYAKDAIAHGWESKVDVVTSFDVIEHVEDPEDFIADYYHLLRTGGAGIIGTPTDAPIMRELLGEVYEKQVLFSTQHLWILGEKSLRLLAQKVGFTDIRFKYFQRHGIGNLFGWLRDKQPNSNLESKYRLEVLDAAWKAVTAESGAADYIVMYLKK